MRESPQVLAWQAQARQEGLTEGYAQGRLEASRDTLLHALQVLLQAPVPIDVATQVQAMSDPDILERWFKVALTALSYDEFRRHLQA